MSRPYSEHFLRDADGDDNEYGDSDDLDYDDGAGADEEDATEETIAPLSLSEVGQLDRLEQTIADGLKTFIDVGTALMVVRDSKLYRQDYATFEEYCRTRWDMGKSRVYQMIDAAMVVDNLKKSTIGGLLPDNERQARELAKLEPEQQVEAWQEAQEAAPDGKPTAKDVQQAVYRRQPKPAPKPTLVEPTYYSPEPKPKDSGVEMTLRAPNGEVIASTREQSSTGVPDGFVNDLIHAHMESETFRFALRSATVEQLNEALGHISPKEKRDRYLKVGNRLELLRLAKDAQMVDEVIEAAMPIIASEPEPTTPVTAPLRSGLIEVLATDANTILLVRAVDDATVSEIDAAIDQLADVKGRFANERKLLLRLTRQEKAKQPPVAAVRTLVNFCERSRGHNPTSMEATGELRQWLERVTA